jgi:hypothetical protein
MAAVPHRLHGFNGAKLRRLFHQLIQLELISNLFGPISIFSV